MRIKIENTDYGDVIMKVIDPSITIETPTDGEEILLNIEKIGRVCYKSEDRITNDSAHTFIRNILKSGHESVIEHVSISVRVICDRGVTHEIVRHRIASYSQESTRYCNYSTDKFNNQITFIRPLFFEEGTENYKLWYESMQRAEDTYKQMIACGASPQEARSVLPNSLKTEIVMTMNLREWRHFLRLRSSKASHPQMRQVAIMMLDELKRQIPIVFDDIEKEI